MGDYHDYVFDVAGRRLVGDFEAMYQAEDTSGFDSWHERDLRPLRKQIAREILNEQNFSSILEIGCGKGTFTHLLKKRNNRVVATDLSPTAIARAQQSYGDIDFRAMTIDEVCAMDDRFDLVIVMGTFAYVENWKDCVALLPKLAPSFFVAEYIPPDPIGYVKSIEELVGTVGKHFNISTKVVIDDVHCMLMASL